MDPESIHLHSIPSLDMLSSYMTLFVGDTVRSAGLEWHGVGHPLYAGSVLSAMKRLPRLQELRLMGAVPHQSADGFIASLPSSHLEVVILENLVFSEKIFRTLATLRKLRRLEIN
ncbi:hypothetical protein FA13DRAFT_1790833 [Coprinellus micaceus]|uniref:F-box domain-containing protein n=1 Tax=Coprinellus micaceus TaxID=71717 RepID=A0A4Y7TGA2_COPMI|nr:hypothetical protein FA13DRAFT_1790833 [Coprinellus micaceus]